MSLNNQVTLETAKKWVKAWREKTDINGAEFLACKIPLEDLNNIAAINAHQAVRAYNAYDEERNLYKVLIVAVDPDGNDMIDGDTPDLPMIYDLTLPCPDTCSHGSPLMPHELK